MVSEVNFFLPSYPNSPWWPMSWLADKLIDKMVRRKPLLYLDTSVFGGCFDKEFQAESNLLFEQIVQGLFEIVVSATTLRELALAPEHVRAVIVPLSEASVFVEISPQVIELRDAYIKAGILGADSVGDAEHIAFATVAEADMIVSWNFKHIVNFRKIKGFQGVNLQYGYKPIDIFSPKEVIYEKN